MGDQVNLSAVNTDYESIRTALQTALANKDSWKGLLPTQTGQTIIDYLASVGALDQMKIMRARQDAFSETAVSDRAQYAIADMQGLRLTRKTPAAATATVTYVQPTSSDPTQITIPAFSQYQAAGTYWFTDTAYVVANGATVTMTLYQGYVVDQSMNGLDEDYVQFVSNEKDFTVSDSADHVQVQVNGAEITRTTDGLWLYKGSAAYVDRTTPDGRLRIQFGTTYYGYRASASDVIRIRYAVTSGADGNSVVTLGARLTEATALTSGTTYTFTSNPSGGADQTPAFLFKTLSPANFGTFGSSVTRQQYLGAALDYGGIVDVKVYAQRELDSTDLKLMNVIKVVPLTSSPFSAAQQASYLEAMQEKTMYSTKWHWVDPIAQPRDLVLTVYCYNYANASECKADAEAAIQNLFAKQRGILARDIFITDIHKTILASNSGIEYVDYISPNTDLLVSGSPMLAPLVQAVNIGTGGIPPGTYHYAVYALDQAGGLTPPTNFTTVTLSSNSNAQITWPAYPNAVTYFIAGRGPTDYFMLGSVSADTLTWTDTGGAPVNTNPLPTLAEYPVQYNSLNSLVVTAEYSTRR